MIFLYYNIAKITNKKSFYIKSRFILAKESQIVKKLTQKKVLSIILSLESIMNLDHRSVGIFPDSYEAFKILVIGFVNFKIKRAKSLPDFCKRYNCPMNYRPFGRTGVQVSELCLGCMNFGDDCSEVDSIALIHRAIDEGINFFDTADVYTRGVSETIVGKALMGEKREQVFLATKVYNRMGEGPNDMGSHRYHIIKGCEDSLRRLNTDHLDLYQIHRPQSSIPIDETLRALDDLVRSGKVRYIGTSTFAAYQVLESLWASNTLHLNRFVCEQPPYNLLDRRIERELLPMCRSYGIATIPWAPLAGGLLSGKYRAGAPRPEGARYASKAAPFARDNESALTTIEKYVAWCDSRGYDPSQVALAWVLHQPGVTSPIIGPKNTAQYEAYMAARSLTLTAEDHADLDALFPPGTHVSEYYRADFGPTARWM